MSAPFDPAEMARVTSEVMRVAQTALRIVTERESTDEAAGKLMALFSTLNRTEALCVTVILAATTASVIDISTKLMVDFVSGLTISEPPDWVIPRMRDDLNAFVRKGLDPDRDEVQRMIYEIFERHARGEE